MDTEQNEPPTKKRSSYERRWQCLCGHEDCAQVSEDLAALAPARDGFVSFRQSAFTKPEPKRGSASYNRSCHFYEGILRHMGIFAKDTVERTSDDNHRHYISLLHFPNEVAAARSGDDGKIVDLDIPYGVGREAGYTDIDLRPCAVHNKIEKCVDDCKRERYFAALPLVTLQNARLQISMLRSSGRAMMAGNSGPERRSSYGSSAYKTSIDENATLLQELAHLRLQVRALQEERDSAQSRAQQLKQQAASEREAGINEFLLHGGLNRANLQSSEWHKRHPRASPDLFGKPWDEICVIIDCLWPGLAPGKTTGEMRDFEQCLIALMRMEAKLTQENLASIWGKHTSNIGRYIRKWSPKWGEAGRDLSILHINNAYLDYEVPQAFIDQGLGDVGLLVDGKDTKTESPRTHGALLRALWSDKDHFSCVRWMTWTTRMGLTVDHTILAGARPQEQSFIEYWAPGVGLKIPPGRKMLTDRGFWRCAIFYPHYNVHLTPNFLSGRAQFTAKEVESDRKICQLRYTSEVALSRTTNVRCLQDVVPREFFSILQDAQDWAHARINMAAPLQMPRNAPAGYFPQTERSKRAETKARKMEK